MEKSPPPCPTTTVTLRRNPPRRARPTPSTVAPLSQPPPSIRSSTIRSFPLEDILSIDLPQPENPKQEIPPPTETLISENRATRSVKTGGQKNVRPQKDGSRTTKAAAAGNKESEVPTEGCYSNLCGAERVDNRLAPDTVVDQKDVVSCAKTAYEKDLKEFAKIEAGGEIAVAGSYSLEPTISGSDSCVLVDEISLSVEGDRSPPKEELNAQVPSSHLSKAERFEENQILDVTVQEQVMPLNLDKSGNFDKILISDPNGMSSIEMVSSTAALEMTEEQCNESTDTSCGNVSSEKEDAREFEEPAATIEIAGCDTSKSIVVGSESGLVLGDDMSSSFGHSQHEEEVDSLDEKLADCQKPQNLKPKRRLQPASSMLLRTVNSMDLDDAKDMPKGKREEKNVSKRTQGTLILLRLLKENT